MFKDERQRWNTFHLAVAYPEAAEAKSDITATHLGTGHALARQVQAILWQGLVCASGSSAMPEEGASSSDALTAWRAESPTYLPVGIHYLSI
eukprot:8076929-Alexandrium_andersonii.AAC.1